MIPTFLAPAWQSIAPALKNHLWQSTLFALLAALLALALRSNRARERYWLLQRTISKRSCSRQPRKDRFE